MNICWYNHRCTKHPEAGGSEEHLHQVAKRLVLNGHTVEVYCEKPNGLSAYEKIDGINYHRKGNRATVHFYALWHTATTSHDLYVDDIAHAVPWLSPLFKKNTLAIMHHIHRDLLIDETGPLLGRILGLLESLTLIFYKKTPFIVVSRSTKSELTKLGIPAKNITIIHNGADIQENTCQKSETPQLIYFGRNRKYKRIELLLKAFKEVNKRLPQTKLVLAGKGTDDLGLTGQIKQVGLEGSIFIKGAVSQEEKNRLLAESWINLLTSVKEGWSITTVEAGYHRTPTVAFDVPGLRDSVIDGETGVLVPDNDLEAYVSNIIDLINDQEHLQRLAENAKRRSQQFTWGNAADQFSKFIRDMEGHK